MASDLEELLLEEKINPLAKHPADIKRFQINDLTYNDFHWQFMETNWPVILCDVSSNWECRTNWTISSQPNNENTSKINFDYLMERIGNCTVPVANCNKEYFNSHVKSEMSFFDFLDYWKHKMNADDIITSTESSNTDLLYLKDWHLKAEQADYEFYKVPKHFASDWLNEYLVNSEKDDYRFVYMGPKGTWTPFHSDVFGSFSWSTNIMGIKKWILLPPNEEQKLCNSLGNLPFSINEKLLDNSNVCYYTIRQKENESVFVPSGWYHQVWNLTDTISVNHNWFNGSNLQLIWRNLSQQMHKVIHEINDCRQMDNFKEHCQTMLRATHGIDYIDFLELLQSIAAYLF